MPLPQLTTAFRGVRIALSCGIALLGVMEVPSLVTCAVAEEPAANGASNNIAVRPVPTIATPEDINRWVAELNHDAFTIRQAAAARLLSAGMPAREALLAIVDGPDPETRAAARRIVALIDRSEFHRRLEAFAADTEGRQRLTLPGWDQYQKLVGADAAARALFVDMQRQEGGLISAALGVSKRPPEDLWEARLLRLVQWQAAGSNRGAAPPLGSCAAMLFLGSLTEMDVSETAAVLIENLIQRPPIQITLQSGNRQDATRRLVVAWLLHCPNKNENILRQRLNLISMMGLEDALPLALTVVKGDEQFPRAQPTTRALATLVVGQLGRREHIEPLEPLLNDTSICLPMQVLAPGQPAATVQVRDVALVVMLQLTSQQPTEYGYANARLQQPPGIYQLQTLFRENDQQRAEAIAKLRVACGQQIGGGAAIFDSVRKNTEMTPAALFL